MSGWSTVALGDVASITRRGVDPTGLVPETRYIGLEHIPTGGGEAVASTLGQHALVSTKFAFTDQHVLFGKLRPNLGKVTLPRHHGVCSTDILPVLPGSRLDRNFLAWFLRRPETTAWAAGRAAGANLPRLSPTELSRLPLPLPPIEEQRRIAAILDQAEHLRAKRRQSIAKVDGLRLAIFLEMFGDLSGSSARGERAQLGGLLARIDSGRSPVCLDRSAEDGEWSVLKLGAISSGQYLQDENKALPPALTPDERLEVRQGDILLSRKNTRELVGASVYVEDASPRHLLPDLIFRLVVRPGSDLDPLFLQAALSLPATRNALRELAGGSAASMVNISKSRLAGLEVPVPPLELQQRFAARSRKVLAARAAARRQGQELESLFASLQHLAFKAGL